MKILFLTLLDFDSLHEQGIYTDLMRQFVLNNHQVTIISPIERRKRTKTHLISFGELQILKLQIGNIQKTHFLEKGISTLLLENQFIWAIKFYFSKEKFDLVVYSTPPITLVKAVEYIKCRDGARSYLLLKDIFPQNALDLGLLTSKGIRGVLYRFFRHKEQKLYGVSDYIGCMSPANRDYVLDHNTFIEFDRVEVCPNSIDPKVISMSETEKLAIRRRYGIPCDKLALIYGGNLGKPQGVDFFIQCLELNADDKDVFFVIVGSGTDDHMIINYISQKKECNAIKLSAMGKEDYEILVNCCDVGLVFLDYRFTIPNFPSRVLSYLQASIPILAATDICTDLGLIIEKEAFGLWCESNDVTQFNSNLKILKSESIRKQMGVNGRNYLESHYSVENTYNIIMRHFE